MIYDYGGRAPQDGAPFGGAVQAWDPATLTHHDYTTGTDVTRPFTAEETVRFAAQIKAAEDAGLLAALAAGIADLESALAVAGADIAAAEARAGQAATLRDAETARAATVTAWQPTAAGATDLATLRSRTVTDLGTVRGDLAAVHEQLATILGAVHELYAARALLARGVSLAFRDLIGLARLAAREIRQD